MARKKASAEADKTPKKMGRPSKNIAYRPPEQTQDDLSADKAKLSMIEKMAEEQCTAEQIAAVMDCSRDTIYTHFSDLLRKGKDKGRRRLVAAMWKKAIEEGNVPMQIWLSKQHLGYKDQQPAEASQISFNVTIHEVPK